MLWNSSLEYKQIKHTVYFASYCRFLFHVWAAMKPT
jgi:hypothetical protein